MELADFMRNKAFNANARKLFGLNSSGKNNLDVFADIFSQMIVEMKSLMRLVSLLDNRGSELRRMLDNFGVPEKVIDSNLSDSLLKPSGDRKRASNTESSIKKVSTEFKEKTIT